MPTFPQNLVLICIRRGSKKMHLTENDGLTKAHAHLGVSFAVTVKQSSTKHQDI